MALSADRDAAARLEEGTFYFCGTDETRRLADSSLPLAVTRKGWHPLETWGLWAAVPDVTLRFRSGQPSGSPLFIGLLLQAPGTSAGPICTVKIDGKEASTFMLNAGPSWHFVEGPASSDGIVTIELDCSGDFARPDARHLYAGFRALVFCAGKDGTARRAIQSRLVFDSVRRAAYPLIKTAFSLAGRIGLTGFAKGRSAHALPAPPHREDPTPSAVEGQGVLAPELFPRPARDVVRRHPPSLDVRQMGQREHTVWGTLRVVRGIAAIRGLCLSATPIVELRILLDGVAIYAGPVRGGYPIADEAQPDVMKKYVFNVWHDFSQVPDGRHEIEVRAIDAAREVQSFREEIAVAAPLTALQSVSDSIVDVATRPETLERDINALPSVVRPGRRRLFAQTPRNVLVMRVDQLGDMVSSVAALRRLRDLLPQARLVGLVSPANEGLAKSLNLFDDLLVIGFPVDPQERRRVMAEAQQTALRETLAKYAFDLAIDLSEEPMSRPLLLLSGAPVLYGFHPSLFPWLSIGFDGVTRDPGNRMECVSPVHKELGLVEWLGLLLASPAEVVPNPALDRSRLAPYSVENKRFAVIHTGARVKFSQWPGFGELAALLLEATDLNVVMMIEDAGDAAAIDAATRDSARFRLVEGRIPFEDFDTLVSFCDVFIGNDSGPKHLASLRGAKVVSLHMARNNWSEWGQDHGGLILSRRVPCCGCLVHYDAEECGKDLVCIKNITPREVLEAVTTLLSK